MFYNIATLAFTAYNKQTEELQPKGLARAGISVPLSMDRAGTLPVLTPAQGGHPITPEAPTVCSSWEKGLN